MTVGRIGWSPVYRVAFSTNRNATQLSVPINASAEAIMQLQATVDALEARIERLENSGGAVTGGLQCEADPSPTVPPE